MKILNLVFFFAISITINAQIKAITDEGDAVFLFDDGSWEYENQEIISKSEIVLNEVPFFKKESSDFLLKSKIMNVGIWLNPKRWSFEKADDNPSAEYEFKLKGSDMYGMLIAEKIEIPLETLMEVALINGKKSSPDLHIIKKEYRIVNGSKVLLLQLDGTMSGIKFSYYGYYFSSKNGTIQFVTYTSRNLLEGYLEASEELLNGLVEINE
ncbi:MAG: hypothetical protein QM499_04180 [Flavobacteriaceae bacterium]